MKRILILCLLVFTLTGCGAVETFETIGDIYQPLASPEPAAVNLLLPDDAAAPVFNGQSGKLYFCEGYEIAVETLEAGDLNRTVTALTGYSEDSLTLLKKDSPQGLRYECAWSAAGEGGDQVGRAVILDDGSYHYCLSLTALADDAGSLQECWQEITSSFQLSS